MTTEKSKKYLHWKGLPSPCSVMIPIGMRHRRIVNSNGCAASGEREREWRKLILAVE